MHELAEHLIVEHNVKKIVYVSGVPGNEECAVRRKAVEDALKEHGLELLDSIVGNFGYYHASMMVNEWIEAGKEMPDAFVCANDLMALGVAGTLYRHDIGVPEDVIVTGFDNIRDARESFPLIATVSRKWDILGERAFEALAEQIAHPDPTYSKYYDSKFVPSESCGCKPTPEALKFRMDVFKNSYGLNNSSEMLDIFFQELRIAMAKVESKEEFFEAAKNNLGEHDYIGGDFCLCTEPLFFELDDENYPKRIRGYSSKMDLLFGKSEGRLIEQRVFDSRELYPGYGHRKDGSDIYVIVPLNNLEFVIGYVVIRNHPKALYDLKLRKFVSDVDALLITIRQYIFAQKSYRKLREIYMTDFLTNTYNRTGCENVLFKFIRDEREKGNTSILAFVDINLMKLINDDFGHLNGDLAIKATADAMRKAFHSDWLFGRYGGDEFVAVGHYDGEDTPEELKTRFVKAMKSISSQLKLRFILSASAGFTIVKPDDNGTVEDFINRADESMYEDKERAHREIEEHRRKRLEKAGTDD